MAKAVRLADIGKKLNVSTVTVSKALSGQKGVSEELRAKIIQLADEMGYQKSESRKNTNEGKSFTLGIIVADRVREPVLLLETLSGDRQAGGLQNLFCHAGSDQQRSGETERTS